MSVLYDATAEAPAPVLGLLGVLFLNKDPGLIVVLNPK